MSYPDFISDREGLDRWRETAREGDGHAFVANKNTVHRFVQTIDKLEAEVLRLNAALVYCAYRVGTSGEIVNASQRGQALADVRRACDEALDAITAATRPAQAPVEEE